MIFPLSKRMLNDHNHHQPWMNSDRDIMMMMTLMKSSSFMISVIFAPTKIPCPGPWALAFCIHTCLGYGHKFHIIHWFNSQEIYLGGIFQMKVVFCLKIQKFIFKIENNHNVYNYDYLCRIRQFHHVTKKISTESKLVYEERSYVFINRVTITGNIVHTTTEIGNTNEMLRKLVQVYQRYGYSYQFASEKNKQHNDTTFSKVRQTIIKTDIIIIRALIDSQEYKVPIVPWNLRK